MGEKINIGDKVICVDDSPDQLHDYTPKIKLNSEYSVIDTGYCSKCGFQWIDVGLKIKLNPDENGDDKGWDEYCGGCDCEMGQIYAGDPDRYEANRFVKKKYMIRVTTESIFISLTPKKVIEQQPVIAN